MQKLQKQYYYNKNGERKLNCYKVNLSRDIIKKAKITEYDTLNIFVLDDKIIIEKRFKSAI